MVRVPHLVLVVCLISCTLSARGTAGDCTSLSSLSTKEIVRCAVQAVSAVAAELFDGERWPALGSPMASWSDAVSSKVERSIVQPNDVVITNQQLSDGNEPSGLGPLEQHVHSVVTGLHRALHHRVGDAMAAADAASAPLANKRQHVGRQPGNHVVSSRNFKPLSSGSSPGPSSSTSQDLFVRPPNFCRRGVVAVPVTQGFFMCNHTTNTSIADWASLPSSQRSECQYQNVVNGQNEVTSQTLTCVCSDDMLLFDDVLGNVDCTERTLDCSTAMGPGFHDHCFKEQYASPPLDMKNCLVTSRRNTSLRLRSVTTCAFAPIDRGAFANLGVTILSPGPSTSSQTLVVIQATNTAVAEQGTYASLASGSSIFSYVLRPGDSSKGLSLTSAHGLVNGSGAMEVQLFNFVHLSDSTQLQRTPFTSTGGNTSTTAAQLLVGAPFDVVYDLTNVSSAFVYGSRIYGEIGLVSQTYLLRPFSVARFFLDFSDVPAPPSSLVGRKVSVVTVVIIVACVVAAAGLVLFLLWHWCHQPPRIDDGLGGLLTAHRDKHAGPAAGPAAVSAKKNQ